MRVVELYKMFENVLGPENAQKAADHLIEMFGGCRLDIPNVVSKYKAERNVEIRKLYRNGTDIDIIIERYTISRRQVIRIIGN